MYMLFICSVSFWLRENSTEPLNRLLATGHFEIASQWFRFNQLEPLSLNTFVFLIVTLFRGPYLLFRKYGHYKSFVIQLSNDANIGRINGCVYLYALWNLGYT